VINRQWTIAQRPLGRPLAESDFAWTESAIRQPGAEEVLVRIDWLSFDPAQKGWMENVADYVEPTEIGDIMPAFAVGVVIESAHPDFVPGDKVTGRLGWSDYVTVAASNLTKLPDDEYTSAHLGILGITGMTAFFGLQRIGKPVTGDTVLVTGAAGATGSAVGQLAKLAGCRVIGVAGGEAKCKWLVDELGFDGAVDYRSPTFRKEVRALVPNGIDILWDNVGGQVFDSLLPRIAAGARVVVCGAISIYSDSTLPPGPSNYMQLVFRRARMEGFIALDYEAEFAWARERLARLLREGKFVYREDVAEGLEAAPATLMRLFSGENRGKQVLKIR